MSEDSFPFGLEQDSLANSLGAAIPNRSLMIVEGEIGGGKSLIAQRLAFGLVENGTKVGLIFQKFNQLLKNMFIVNPVLN